MVMSIPDWAIGCFVAYMFIYLAFDVVKWVMKRKLEKLEKELKELEDA